MTYDTLLVSCVIATHNRKSLLSRAISSILMQTYENIELIIVVDCCDDGTESYLRNCYGSDQRIRIITSNEPLGAASARNRGIDAASGTFISFLDDDDEWLPKKIERQVEFALKGYDFVTCTRAIYVIDGKASVYGSRMPSVTIRKLFTRNPIISVSPLIRISLMRSIYFNPEMPALHDYDAWIRILLRGAKTTNINEALIRYHREPGLSLSKIRYNKLHMRKKIYIKYKNIMTPREKYIFLIKTILKYLIPDPRYYFKRCSHYLISSGRSMKGNSL